MPISKRYFLTISPGFYVLHFGDCCHFGDFRHQFPPSICFYFIFSHPEKSLNSLCLFSFGDTLLYLGFCFFFLLQQFLRKTGAK